MEDKREIIKELFQQLNHKSKFIEELAVKLVRSEKTLRKWWFSNYGLWSVPKEFQDEVIQDLEETIKNQ